MEGNEEQKQEAKSESKEQRSPRDLKIEELRKSIEAEKKMRGGLIDGARRLRRRIAYKQAEQAAITKLISMSTEKTKNIGYLKRLKERLEFRISTEATSLAAEKELIRRINEVNGELERSIKSYKLRKKLDFINGDIEELNKQSEEQERKIGESTKKLDELYSSLRSTTGYRGERQNRRERRPSKQQQKQQEISLADIAVIKGGKNENSKGAEIEDIETSNN